MWFTETPWPPIIICAMVAVVLTFFWFSNRRGIYLLGVLGLAILGGVILAAEKSIITESERVEASVYGLTSAFADRRQETTLNYISPNAPEIQGLVHSAWDVVDEINGLRVTDVRVDMTSNDTRALSHFRANADVKVRGHGNVGRQPSRWELTWQLEAGQWKVVKIRRLNPIDGSELQLLQRSAG